MIIDLEVNGDVYLRYESNTVPRVGETISTLRPDRKTFLVEQVDYLLQKRHNDSIYKEILITLSVKEI